MKEHVKQDPDDIAGWECVCGNTTDRAGFAACNSAGNKMEPTIDSDWNDVYVYNECGRVIDQNTLEVIGRKSNPVLVS
jgi:hypothetical protein